MLGRHSYYLYCRFKLRELNAAYLTIIIHYRTIIDIVLTRFTTFNNFNDKNLIRGEQQVYKSSFQTILQNVSRVYKQFTVCAHVVLDHVHQLFKWFYKVYQRYTSCLQHAHMAYSSLVYTTSYLPTKDNLSQGQASLKCGISCQKIGTCFTYNQPSSLMHEY